MAAVPTVATTLALDKSFLPRKIEFQAASSSSSAGAAGEGAADKSQSMGPQPAYYLYPRDRLFDHCRKQPTCKVGRGLRNAGNTCFFNSVMQALTHTAPLQSLLLSGEHTASCKAKKEGGFCALCLFESHAKEALTGASRQAYTPKPLLQRLKELGGKQMKLGRQEDAHEFLIQFLDACHRSALKPIKDKQSDVALEVQRTTPIHQLFGGYLRSQVLCLTCKSESNVFDPFMDLNLEVNQAASVEKALEGFTKSEKLCGQNRYRCKHCQAHRDSTKQFTIATAPPLLTIQLKRFECCFGQRGKINKNVSFKLDLDLSRFTSRTDQEAKYRLYAVIVHRGHSARSGHYIAYARHPSTDKWYEFDDEAVRLVKETEVLRQQAYLLFYQKRSIPPPAPSVPEAAKRKASASSPPSESESTLAPEECSRARQEKRREPEPSLNEPGAKVRKLTEQGSPSSSSSSSASPTKAASCGVPALETQPQPITLTEGILSGALPVSQIRRFLPRLRCESRLKRLRRMQQYLKTQRRSQAATPAVAELTGAGTQPAAVEAGDAELQTPEERVTRASSVSTQFGLATVDRWDDAEEDVDADTFAEAQRKLHPEVQRRDEHDTEYDAGKLKHKPKKKKDKAAFQGKQAFDRLERVRQRNKEMQRPREDTTGKGFAKGKSKGKARGKHKSSYS